MYSPWLAASALDSRANSGVVPKARWTEAGAEERGEGVLGDLTVHLVDQALLLFGPARRVYAEFERRHPDIVVVDDVFIAITHKRGVISHLFTSPNVGILGPRLTVLGSKGAYVKHGIDPQEEALLAGGTPGTPGVPPARSASSCGSMPCFTYAPLLPSTCLLYTSPSPRD